MIYRVKAIPPDEMVFDFSFEETLPLDSADRKLLRWAKKGDLYALRNLGCEYIWGENGFPHNEERARHWYLIAAQYGYEEARWDVATMLIYGEGGPKDVDTGLDFLKKLARKRRYSVYAEQAAKWLVHWYKDDDEQAKYWEVMLQRQKRLYRDWIRLPKRYKRRFLPRLRMQRFCRRCSIFPYRCRRHL